MADEPKSIDHREMARKAQDRHKVYNTTDKDYPLMWDGYVHLIPAKGEAVLPWYQVKKYLTEMTDKILTERQDGAVKSENEKRKSLGKEEMEKFGEQQIFEDKFRFREGASNPEARKAIMKTLYGGLVEEYGLDVRPDLEGRTETRPVDEQILEEIQSEAPIISTVEEEKAPIEELESKNVFQLQKMAREKGFAVDKTSKKDELIAKISQ